MEPVSESRHTETLQPVFCHYKHWYKMNTIILTEISYPLSKTDKDKKIEHMKHMISRGNHKLATIPSNKSTLLKNFNKDQVLKYINYR